MSKLIKRSVLVLGTVGILAGLGYGMLVGLQWFLTLTLIEGLLLVLTGCIAAGPAFALLLLDCAVLLSIWG